MLSLRILGLRDVPRPPAKESLGQSKDMMNNRGSNGSDSSGVLWAVQVSHGSQQHRTQFVALSTTDSEMKDNMLVNAKEEKSKHGNDAVLSAASKLWEEEVEIEDKREEDIIEIALLFDIAPRATAERKLFRHSVARLDMPSFRAQPEKRVELWQPLHSMAPNVDTECGAIQLALTYTDDYVGMGYMFGLFCGLAPLSFPTSWP